MLSDSFEQRLRAIKEAENEDSLHRVHDIGFPRAESRARRQDKAKELREARKRMKADEALERASRLQQLEVDPVECEMEDAAVGGGEGEDVDVARNCAKHFGVFNDLYGEVWTLETGRTFRHPYCEEYVYNPDNDYHIK